MIIECTIYKPSGKWYTDEPIEIPDDTPDFNMPSVIQKYARLRNMIYHCYQNNGVPMLVHVGD